MADTQMPAAEVNTTSVDERRSYEFAFHVLPTVAEGEVTGVFDSLKAHITKAGGEITIEEAPERIDLAYEVVKSFEGKNRRFKSAYFGWVRFRLASESLEALEEELLANPHLLRSLCIKLTRDEEAHPFRFHENRKSTKLVEVIDEEVGVVSEAPREDDSTEEGEVSEEELDASLNKITEEDVDGDREVK